MNENTPIPPVENANSGASKAELVALLADVRAYWGSVEAHILSLIGHRDAMGVSIVTNHSDRPEPVLTEEQWRKARRNGGDDV